MSGDVILNKKESIERCVRQIRAYYARPADEAFARDHLKQDAIAANLQRACEQAIDLANHTVRKYKLGVPKDSKDSFAMLGREKIITEEIAAGMQRMAGFRNMSVHQYQELDMNVFVEIIERRLDDFVVFTSQILRYTSGGG